ncbi:MAG: S8 family peptidase [Sarcina sp.]
MEKFKTISNNILGYRNEFNSIPDGVKLIGATEFWSMGYLGKGIKIAIIDTGCDVNHVDIKDRIIDTRNFTNENLKDINNVTDYDGHGTHVAGIIAANGNEGIFGVAPKADLIILKALTSNGGYYNWIINAINYAIQSNVDIISMSLGGKLDYKPLHAVIKKAVSKNILVVGASGNDGDSNDETMEINYPAAYNECISVGSITINSSPSYFTASNLEVDLLAPGQGINGRGIISLAPNNKYVELTGTSMATPHISGALALLKEWSKDTFNRTLTESELYAQLIKRTISLGYPKSIEGNGLLDLSLHLDD